MATIDDLGNITIIRGEQIDISLQMLNLETEVSEPFMPGDRLFLTIGKCCPMVVKLEREVDIDIVRYEYILTLMPSDTAGLSGPYQYDWGIFRDGNKYNAAPTREFYVDCSPSGDILS